MKSIYSVVFCCLSMMFCCALSAQENNTGMPILKSDTRSVIAIPDKPSKTEQFAAGELRKYINKMTGAIIQVVPESKIPESDIVFTVGNTKANKKFENVFDKAVASSGSDSFVINTDGSTVSLVGGGDRGTLYSVYEFLEKCGCRWFFPGPLGEYIPHYERLPLPAAEGLRSPYFIQREIDLGCNDYIPVEEQIDWCAKNRLNKVFALRGAIVKKYLPGDAKDAWEKRGGMLNWQWIAHNLNMMVPPEKYFDSHPEYYALYKGKRARMGVDGKSYYGGGNLCTTNTDVIKLCADFITEWFSKNPDGMLVPLWPGDGTIKWCECDECSKLGGKNFSAGEKGSMSLRMATFANAVAKIVGEKFPDRLILCPAYANYIRPAGIKMEKNVMVQYCLHGDYAHALNKSKENSEEREWFEGWAENTNSGLGVWEYFLIGDLRPDKTENKAMLPLAYRIRDNVSFLKSKGARYYFTQCSSKYWRHNIFTFYATARLLWDPDMDFQKFKEDYFAKMYGNAGKEIEEYYSTIEESVAKSDWHPSVYSDVAVPSPKVFTPQVIEKCGKLLEAASDRQMDEIQRKRFALVKETYVFIKSNVGNQEMLGLDPNAQWRIERKENHYVINADGKEISDDDVAQIVTNAVDSGTYDENFERILLRARKRNVPVVSIENQKVKIAVIPELGGRIIRMTDKRSGKNFIKESPAGDRLKSIGELYFNYGGYEEYVGKSFGDPGWEKPFKWTKVEDEKKTELKLSAEISGFLLERTISVMKGNDAAIDISSALTNNSGEAKSICLRVHPVFTLGGNCGEYKVFVEMKNKTIKTGTVNECNDTPFPDTAGKWAIFNESADKALVEIFDPEQAVPYLCKTGADFLNVELLGKERILKPGESLVIKHRYILLDNAARELPEYFKLPTVSRIEGNVSFKPGLIGSAAAFDGKNFLNYNARQCLNPAAGTIEVWIKSRIASDNIRDACIFSAGNNSPFWIMSRIDKGKILFMYKNGSAPYRKKGEFYASLTENIKLEPGVWRHLAFVWKADGKEKSIMQLYLDGNIIAEASNLTLEACGTPEVFALGTNSARKLHPYFDGEVDELRTSSAPKTATEIKSAYELGRSGIPLSFETESMALFHFDSDTTGIAAKTDKQETL